MKSTSCFLLSLLALANILQSVNAASAVGYVGGIVALGVAVLAGLVVQHSVLAPVYTPEPGSLSGKTAVITGANTGLCLESAKKLAVGGAKVILTVRSEAKGQAAVQAVQDYVRQVSGQEADASYKVLQLDSLAAVRSSLSSWDDVPTIDILLNNAAMFGGSDLQLSNDGMEVSFQTNHLGYFLVTGLLQDKLAPNARIVNVASDAYRTLKRLEFDYIWNPTKEEYGFFRSYANAKLANILFSQELQRRANAAGKNWSVVACHPGLVSTDIFRSDNTSFGRKLFDMFAVPAMRSTDQGATTQVWLAASAEQDVNVRGQYVADQVVRKLEEYAKDTKDAERLWKESEERSGFEFTVRQTSEETITDGEGVSSV